MRISVTTVDGQFYSFDVSPSMEVSSLKALIAAEVMNAFHEQIENQSGISAASQRLLLNGKELADDAKSLTDCQIKSDDMLLVMPARQQASSSSSTVARPSGQSALDQQAESVRQSLLSDPNMMRQIATTQPALAEAALSNPQKFRQMFGSLQEERMKQEKERLQEISRLEADPFDIESQRKIEELIQKKNIQQNMEHAIEYNPEAFGRVIMLYIDCEVNGHPVKAFVDSGAQATIISPDCAEACKIMRLCDPRFAGVAKGVGTAKILGRVHSAPLKLGNHADSSKNLFLQCAFTIMEGKDVDMLLGLDMLKRFQAVIDLSKEVLRIGDFETPFLAEKDLPEKARWTLTEQPKSPNASSAASASSKLSASNTPAPTAPGTRSTTTEKMDEGKIQTLMQLGATRDQAIQALSAAGGNVDMAASVLFNFD